MTDIELGPNGTVVPPVGAASTATYKTGQSTHAYPEGPRRLSGLTKWLRIGLFGYIGVEILLSLSSAMMAFVPGIDAYEPTGAALVLSLVLALVALLYLIVMIYCIVLVCRWTYRAMRNLHTVGSASAEMSPGWAVGWYFIPFANLVLPAKGMSQIYHGSAEAVGENTRDNSPIGIWWGCWLLTGILSNGSSRIPDFNAVTATLDILSGVLGVIAAVQLLKIIRETTARQRQFGDGGIAKVFE